MHLSTGPQARSQNFSRGGGFLFGGGEVDLKPKGGLIWEKCGRLYYTLYMEPLAQGGGGGVFGLPRPPPPPAATGLVHNNY